MCAVFECVRVRARLADWFISLRRICALETSPFILWEAVRVPYRFGYQNRMDPHSLHDR